MDSHSRRVYSDGIRGTRWESGCPVPGVRAMADEQPADQPDGQPAKKGRGKGRPFPKGESPNPSGKPKDVPDDPLGGVVTAARMRRVLAQDKRKDVGPTDQALRS